MTPSNPFSVKSSIELNFDDSHTCDIAYNSFLPEYDKIRTERSKVLIEKKDKSLIFSIECTDITAFRASVSEIIGFGKIVENTIELSK